MPILNKEIYRLDAIPNKGSYFKEIEKTILKFMWKHKRLRIAKAMLRKKSKAGGITGSNFNIYNKDAVIKECVKWKSLSRIQLFATPWINYIVRGVLQARILEFVAFPFSRGSFQPTDRTQVSHISGGFLTNGTTREAQEYWGG